MKNCFKCKCYKDNRCTEDTRKMAMICLLRVFLWGQNAKAGLLKKTEEFIDNANKDINSGEDWKK